MRDCEPVDVYSLVDSLRYRPHEQQSQDHMNTTQALLEYQLEDTFSWLHIQRRRRKICLYRESGILMKIPLWLCWSRGSICSNRHRNLCSSFCLDRPLVCWTQGSICHHPLRNICRWNSDSEIEDEPKNWLNSMRRPVFLVRSLYLSIWTTKEIKPSFPIKTELLEANNALELKNVWLE